MITQVKRFVPIAILLFASCNKEDNNTKNDSAKVAIDISLDVSKSGNDLLTVQQNGFYLFVDQGASAARDYYVKMKYNFSSEDWDMYDAQSGDKMDVIYWDDLASKDNKVVALYSDKVLTQSQISSQYTFATTANQGALDLDEFNKLDMLYATTSCDVEGVSTAEINQQSGVIDLSLQHLRSIVYIETAQEFGSVHSLTLSGTSDGFSLNCADYSSLSISDTKHEIVPYLESTTNNSARYAAYITPGNSTVMVALHTTKNGETITYNSRLFTHDFKGGGAYKILIDNPDEVAGSFDLSIGEWKQQQDNPFANVESEAVVQEVIEVSSASKLLSLAEQSYSHYQDVVANDYSTSIIRLTSNIDLQGVDFPGFGTHAFPFKGEFDGAGYTISNLTMANFDFYQGLFRSVGHGAKVYDLTVKNFVIGGTHFFKEEHCYGALAGDNRGTIKNCKAVGCTVTAGDKVGGLVGQNYYGFVINCTSEDCIVNGYDIDASFGDVIGLDF